MTAKCNLIFDSCCDLSQAVLDDADVLLARPTYLDGDEEHFDDLFESVSAHDFYQAMRDGATPHSSQVSIAEFDRVFREALATGVPTVYIAFSSGISGTYEAAVTALDALKAEKGDDIPLYAVDAKIASTSLSVLATEAIRQRERGLTAEQMVAWVEEARYFVQTIFMVDNLDALHRGGRIPASVAVAGSKLDVKPLLSFDIDGKLAIVGVARGRKKGMKRMLDYYEKNKGDANNHMVFLGNADCLKDSQKLADMLAEHDPAAVANFVNIGPVIGCHVGPGMMSLCFWGEDRRKSISVTDRIANKIKQS